MKIKLNYEIAALLNWYSRITALSTSEIIERLLSAHMEELWELHTFLQTYPVGSKQYEQGKNLLISFGPESILAGIKNIDPTYLTVSERFRQALYGSNSVKEVEYLGPQKERMSDGEDIVNPASDAWCEQSKYMPE